METKKGTPIVTEMQVIPVAGYDSMLMTLSGAHAPYFTRNIVILKDSSGNTGIGEIHGGDYTCESLRSCIPLVVGKEIGRYRSILNDIKNASTKAAGDDGEGIQSLDISKLKFVVKAQWAIECALLDLLGQHLNLPMCELLGDGKQRDEIETLGYLFYVSDKNKAKELPYLDESDSDDAWFRLRREEMLTPERIVEQAKTLHEKYGFINFKLKGGVLKGEEEMEAVKALKQEFPQGRMEIMCEFKNAVNIPVATNMIAVNWRQFYHATSLRAVDIVLADPHFWGFDGSVRMAQILNDWGLTWGSHSNNHFDITLTAFAHVAAAAPGNPTALDTHWIWQDGQNLLKDTPLIKNGYLQVPTKPGLGVTIDMDRVMEANKLYNELESHDRDDSMAMQYLIKDWKFDSKKPALVR